MNKEWITNGPLLKKYCGIHWNKNSPPHPPGGLDWTTPDSASLFSQLTGDNESCKREMFLTQETRVGLPFPISPVVQNYEYEHCTLAQFDIFIWCTEYSTVSNSTNRPTDPFCVTTFKYIYKESAKTISAKFLARHCKVIMEWTNISVLLKHKF